MTHKLVFFFILLLCIACSKEKEIPAQGEFFSLRSALEEEKKRLKPDVSVITKYIQFGEANEKKDFNKPDWDSEFEPFLEYDINRPSWKNSYKADSSFSGDSTLIRYIAIDSSMKVKWMEIVLVNDRFKSMQGRTHSRSAWYALSQQVYYQADSGFSIRGARKAVLSDSVTYSIRVNFN